MSRVNLKKNIEMNDYIEMEDDLIYMNKKKENSESILNEDLEL
jgi:hypothetical protein